MRTGAGVKVQHYYDNFVRSSNIKTVFNASTEHTFVRSTRLFFYFLCSSALNCSEATLNKND